MRSNLNHLSRIFFLTVLSLICFLIPVNAEQAVTPGDGSETVLIDYLRQKGIINAEDVVKLKSSNTEAGTEITDIINLLEQKKIISSTEARVLEMKLNLKKQQQNTDVFVTKEEFRKFENELNKSLDDVQIEPRLNERELNRIEEERIDPLYSDMLKASWTKRISLKGDIRLRFQQDNLDENNAILLKPGDPDEIMNTTVNRTRYRARLRLDAKAKILDPGEINVGKMTVNVRLSTGNEKDPTSTNETLGDYYNKDSIVLDRYYLAWQYEPELPLLGRIPQVTLTGGKMPNPWFSSDLVWDSDVNFEGLTLSLLTDTLQSNSWHAFLSAGAFPLQELEIVGPDKWLYGGQLGFEVQPVYGLQFKLGGAYYQYENITGIVNNPLEPGQTDYSAPVYQQKGNTLIDIDPEEAIKTAYASEFKIIDATGLIDITVFYPVHIIFEGTYAKNIGFDKDKVKLRTGIDDIEEDTEAHRFGLKIGYPETRNFGEWNFSYYFKYVEADAVLDAFTDSDFHLGGTNAKGWIAGMELGLYNNVWLTSRWLTADEIDGPPMSVDVLQVDINAKF